MIRQQICGRDQPKARVAVASASAIMGLEKAKRLRFYDAVFAYAFGGEEPDFDDAELTALWQKTRVSTSLSKGGTQ